MFGHETLSASRDFPSYPELLQKFVQLEEAVHRRNLMAIAAGHDLSHSLQAILSTIEQIATTSTCEGSAFWRAVAEEQIRQMASDLSEMTLTSYDHSQPGTEFLTPFPLTAVFERVEADWQACAIAKDIDLRFIPSSAMVIDEQAIVRTMLTNLVGNAVKYTELGGVVVGCRRLGERLAIEVVDTGSGIDDRLKCEMFGAFARGSASSMGFGLGLWLVRNLAQSYGHQLQFWSKPGTGSRFRLTLNSSLSSNEI